MIRVYRFGLLAPVDGAISVRQQLRAAREYRNDLVAIERGRRWALRQIDATDEVRAAEELVRSATKSDHKARVQNLRAERKRARDGAETEHSEIEGGLAGITTREHEILLGARELTSCFWGSYLDIESAHRQARGAPLYDDDALTPHVPRFLHARQDGLFEGQLGIQIQSTKPLTTAEVWSAEDTRVRLEPAPAFGGSVDKQGRLRACHGRKAILAMRVGSDGREPIWARWPIWVDREIPDAARWKWVRVSVRLRGLREDWSCEITVDDPAPRARDLDTELSGAIAIEWCWEAVADDELRVARWADDRGGRGEVVIPDRIARGFIKADGIRSVRDTLANDARPRIARAIQESADRKPLWLARAGATLHLWRSLIRMHDLARRWRADKCDAAREAYDLLQAWELRDSHLWDYETGVRRSTLGQRRDIYRVFAARLARDYKSVILSNQDLSREARWGDEGTARFRAAPGELRDAIANSMRGDVWDGRWRDGAREEEREETEWCERAIGAWIAGGARAEEMFSKRVEKSGNAWARRKAKKKERGEEKDPARKPGDKAAE